CASNWRWRSRPQEKSFWDLVPCTTQSASSIWYWGIIDEDRRHERSLGQAGWSVCLGGRDPADSHALLLHRDRGAVLWLALIPVSEEAPLYWIHQVRGRTFNAAAAERPAGRQPAQAASPRGTAQETSRTRR